MTMGATPTRRAMGSRRYRGPELWILAILVMVGALVQACTDNSGPAGPSFGGTTVPVTSDSGAANVVNLLVSVGPGGDQFTFTVFVRGATGKPIEGASVFVSTNLGRLSPTDGVTDASGRFVSVLTCGDGGAGVATVTAFAGFGAAAPVTATATCP